MDKNRISTTFRSMRTLMLTLTFSKLGIGIAPKLFRLYGTYLISKRTINRLWNCWKSLMEFCPESFLRSYLMSWWHLITNWRQELSRNLVYSGNWLGTIIHNTSLSLIETLTLGSMKLCTTCLLYLTTLIQHWDFRVGLGSRSPSLISIEFWILL
jgi:hypothetical protein